jgi:hypothetical protein
MKRLVPSLACLLLACSLPAAARIEVTVSGAVHHAGTLSLPDGASLSVAALAAGVRRDAYPLGAAWLRPQDRTAQVRLKAGIEYDLGALHRRALLHGDAERAAALRRLRAWIASLPVTGRVPALLQPRVVEATPTQNRPLAPGDALYYPTRPRSVRVVGALARPCKPAFRPLADARSYLADCASGALASRNWAWVVQPDGHLSKRGIASWNLSAPKPLAPGAMIYVPIAHKLAATVDDGLNRDIARFLATQVLPGPGAPR